MCGKTLKQINYQYRNGTTFPVALRTLYADGGIPRFYRGVLPALIQGPMSRFGDTAANTGMLTLLDNLEQTKDLNVGFKTVAASSAAALFRIFLMPVDTVKVRRRITVPCACFGSFVGIMQKFGANGLFQCSAEIKSIGQVSTRESLLRAVSVLVDLQIHDTLC